MTTRNTETEQALRDLSALFPKHHIYLDQQASYYINPKGKRLNHYSAHLEVNADDGTVAYDETTWSLAECVAKARKWKKSQS
jgi:hypothetical protein